MRTFAKLFEFETGQLLITIDEDFHPDTVEIIIRTDTEDLSVSKKLKFNEDNLEDGRQTFIDFNEESAKKQFDGMQALMARSEDTNG